MREISEEPRWEGPAIDDELLLDQLPADLRVLLSRTNGFIDFGGGLHIRGACNEPSWHSLRYAWLGDQAFCRHYRCMVATDIPFAQEATGDQFLLRDGMVHRLSTETDELEDLDVTLSGFLDAVARDPVQALLLQPFVAFRAQGGTLVPGQLLSSYPPFCFVEAGQGSSFSAVPVDDQLAFLAQLSSQLRDMAPGAKVSFRVVP